ncbi:MAG: radical SAM protein [Thermodesulfobacteriota bacterium]
MINIADVKEFQKDPQVLVEITSKCNFSCSYCSSAFKEREKMNMPMDLFRHILAQLPGLTTKGIRMHIDGEPTSHPRFFDMAQAVNEAGLRVSLATNGSLLRPEYLVFDMDQLVTVSTNGEEFAMRNKAMNFDRYIERIISYVQEWTKGGSKANIGIQVPYLPEKKADSVYKQEKEAFIMEFIEQSGVRKACVQDVKNPLLFRNRDGRRLVIIRHHIVKAGLYPEGGKKNLYTPVSQGFCDSAWKRMAILADGRVSFCCIDLSGATSYTAPDEIWQKSLSFFWHEDERIKRIRETFLEEKVTIPVCQICLAAAPDNRRIVAHGA